MWFFLLQKFKAPPPRTSRFLPPWIFFCKALAVICIESIDNHQSVTTKYVLWTFTERILHFYYTYLIFFFISLTRRKWPKNVDNARAVREYLDVDHRKKVNGFRFFDLNPSLSPGGGRGGGGCVSFRGKGKEKQSRNLITIEADEIREKLLSLHVQKCLGSRSISTPFNYNILFSSKFSHIFQRSNLHIFQIFSFHSERTCFSSFPGREIDFLWGRKFPDWLSRINCCGERRNFASFQTFLSRQKK